MSHTPPPALRRLAGRARALVVGALRRGGRAAREREMPVIATALLWGAAAIGRDAAGWMELAQLRRRRGEAARALADLDRALARARGSEAAEVVLAAHAVLRDDGRTLEASEAAARRAAELAPGAKLVVAEGLVAAGDLTGAVRILAGGPGDAPEGLARRWDRLLVDVVLPTDGAVTGTDGRLGGAAGNTGDVTAELIERVLAGDDAETIRTVVGHLLDNRPLTEVVAWVARRGRGLPRGARGDLCRALRLGGRFSDALAIAGRDGLPDDPWWEGFAEELRVQIDELDSGLGHLLVEATVHPGEALTRVRPVRAGDPRSGVVYAVRHSLPPTRTGYTIRTQALVDALIGAGESVTVCSEPGFAGPGPDTVGRVRYVRLPPAAPTPSAADAVRWHAHRLAEVVDGHGARILHAASNWRSGYAAAVAGRHSGAGVIYEVRGLWELTSAAHEPERVDSEGYAWEVRMESEVLSAVDRVLAISEAIVPELVRRGADPAAVTIVPNGVDVDRFRPRPRDAALEAELELAGHRVIGFAGSVRPLEGLVELMEAVAAMRGKTEESVRVVVVGDGEGMGELRAALDRFGLGDVVRLVGAVDHAEVDRYLTLFDIAPFPRRPAAVSELVTPLKPLEAMATGATVVVSDVAALAEMVEDGVTGLHVAKGDVGALTDCLARLVDDRDLATELATAARRHVERERTWDAAARRVAAVYRELEQS